MFRFRRISSLSLTAILAAPALASAMPAMADSPLEHEPIPAIDASATGAALHAETAVRTAVAAASYLDLDLGEVEAVDVHPGTGVASVVFESGTATHHLDDGSVVVATDSVYTTVLEEELIAETPELPSPTSLPDQDMAVTRMLADAGSVLSRIQVSAP